MEQKKTGISQTEKYGYIFLFNNQHTDHHYNDSLLMKICEEALRVI